MGDGIFSEMELFVTERVARREGANADYSLYTVERCSLIIRTLSVENLRNSHAMTWCWVLTYDL